MFFRTAAICAVAWAVAIIILKSNHAESACRMAYMNPKYIPHPFVDSKYGLYLYRDMHWNVGDSITVGSNITFLIYLLITCSSQMVYRCYSFPEMLALINKDGR